VTAPERIIDIVRHGETCAHGRLIGRTDACLSVAGWRQMSACVRALPVAAETWTIYSSPQRRCLRFARQLAKRQAARLHIEADLREMDFGDWEGLPWSRLGREPAFMDFLRAPERHAPPHGESLACFARRVERVLARLLDGDARHCLLITHGGVLRLACCHLLDLPYRAMSCWHVPPAGHVRLRVRAGRAMLESLNAATLSPRPQGVSSPGAA